MTGHDTRNGRAYARFTALEGGDRHTEGEDAPQRHTGGRRASLHRLGALLAEAAAECQRLAREAEDRLDVPAERALMDGDMPEAPEHEEPRCPQQLEVREPPRLLSVDDVATRLGVDAKTVRRWRRQKQLPPALTFGGVIRWRPEAIEEWLQSQEDAA